MVECSRIWCHFKWRACTMFCPAHHSQECLSQAHSVLNLSHQNLSCEVQRNILPKFQIPAVTEGWKAMSFPLRHIDCHCYCVSKHWTCCSFHQSTMFDELSRGAEPTIVACAQLALLPRGSVAGLCDAALRSVLPRLCCCSCIVVHHLKSAPRSIVWKGLCKQISVYVCWCCRWPRNSLLYCNIL